MTTHSQRQHTRSVTMQDIADRCGVSKVTVSMALRGNRSEVSEAMIARILAVAHELGYNPSHNESARRLALRKSGQDVISRVIALFFPKQFAKIRYFVEIIEGILEVVTEQEFALIIAYLETEAKSVPLPPVIGRGDVDAAIVFGNPPPLRLLLGKLRNNPQFGRRPVVSLVRPIEGCSAVVTDDRSGSRAAMQHLLDLGHRHIVFFTGTDYDYPWYQRLDGYRDAFLEYGLDPIRYMHRVIIDFQLPRSERIKAPLTDLLLHRHDITAILAQNDSFAVEIHDILCGMGLSVPRDISLIGFDDTEEILDSTGKNILTTVRLPLAQVGAAVAKLTIGRITGEVTDDTVTVLPSDFIVRGSTAPPKPREAK